MTRIAEIKVEGCRKCPHVLKPFMEQWRCGADDGRRISPGSGGFDSGCVLKPGYDEKPDLSREETEQIGREIEKWLAERQGKLIAEAMRRFTVRTGRNVLWADISADINPDNFSVNHSTAKFRYF